MKKLFTWLLLTVLLVGMLSGCGNKQQVISNEANSLGINEEKTKKEIEEKDFATSTDKAETTTAKDSTNEKHGGPVYPDESQIKNDLMVQNANCFNIASASTCLDIDTIEIVRRKSDDQYDEVYISALLRNEHYIVETGYTLFYSLYDVGGWCLDYYITEDFFVTGIKAPITEEEFRAKLLEEFTYCEILDRTQEMDSKGNWCDIFSFRTSFREPCLTVKHTGTATYTYDDDCWREQFDFDEPDTDWRGLVDSWSVSQKGVYAKTANSGGKKCDIEITVDISGAKQLSETELEVSYSGRVYIYEYATQAVAMDTVFPERTAVLKIFTADNLFHDALRPNLPVTATIEVPWPGPDDARSADIRINENGLYMSDMIWNNYSLTFKQKGPSDEELQAAMDKLKALNGLA